VLAVLWSLLIGISVGSCTAHTDECESGAYGCDGDVARNCRLQIDDGHYFYWNTSQCKVGLCRTDSSSAFCTLSGTPEPSCGADSETACAGTSVAVCHSGYALSKTDCASAGRDASSTSGASNASAALTPLHLGPQSSFCIANGRQAFCAAESEPNSNCNTRGSAFAEGERVSAGCDGDDALACVNGYVVSRQSCNGLCITDGINAYCPLSPEPDPSCPLSEHGSQHCVGQTLVGCSTSGYRILEEQCAARETCVSLSSCPTADPACAVTIAVCAPQDRMGGSAR